MADFVAKFSTDQIQPNVQFDGDTEVNAVFGEVQTVGIGGELYKGDYTVIPKIDQQVMPTKGKLLVKDVTIKAIPIFRTSNPAGGTTVYIANEV